MKPQKAIERLTGETLETLTVRGRGVELEQICIWAGLSTNGTSKNKAIRLLNWFGAQEKRTVKKITTITIDNVFRKEEGERKVAKLKGITKGNYHNFTYGVCPVGGSFDIVVSSDYDFEGDAEKEMYQTFVYILSNQI